MGFPSKLWFCSMLSRVLKDSLWNRSKSFVIRKTSSACVFSLAHYRRPFVEIKWDVRWILSIPPRSSNESLQQTNMNKRLPLIPRSIPSCWNLLTLNVPPLGTVTELLLKYSTILLICPPSTIHPLKIWERKRENALVLYLSDISYNKLHSSWSPSLYHHNFLVSLESNKKGRKDVLIVAS